VVFSYDTSESCKTLESSINDWINESFGLNCSDPFNFIYTRTTTIDMTPVVSIARVLREIIEISALTIMKLFSCFVHTGSKQLYHQVSAVHCDTYLLG